MADFPQIGKHRIGFVSTRFTGTDGVSLETTKWVEILKRLGNTCFFFAGASDHSPQISRIVPEASFVHPEVRAIQAAAFGARARPTALTRRIEQIKDYLKDQLYAFIRDFEIELLLPENVLAIPMNIPLGVALAELIAETGIITIAHHHDFFWERKQYLVNCVWDYLSMAFPPHLPSIHHVVINSSAGTQLDLRTGSSAWFVPNVMDFDHPPPAPDDYVSDLRATLGIAENEYLFLQPTRIVQRKGIEHAIELTKRIGRPARLVLSASADDEGDAYENRVKSFAALLDVPLVFASDIIRPRRGTTADGRKIYSLGDLYTAADLNETD